MNVTIAIKLCLGVSLSQKRVVTASSSSSSSGIHLHWFLTQCVFCLPEGENDVLRRLSRLSGLLAAVPLILSRLFGLLAAEV